MAHLREVAPGVLVATSRFMVTNTVVVVHGDGALVIDPGVHPDELDALADELADRGLAVVGGFATHAHWDHVLWTDRLGEVPRWSSDTTAQLATDQHADLVADARKITDVDARRLGRVTGAVDALPWDGPDAILVEHDAHQRGHTALHVPELGLLVAGDMGSDVEIPLLEHGIPGPDALAAYQAGLDVLAGLATPDIAVTGHGTICDGAEWRQRLDADRRYLDRLAGGRIADDPRLTVDWLRDAHHEMRATLDKPAWRRWARGLDLPVDPALVCEPLREFLGDAPGDVAAYSATDGEIDIATVVAALPDPVLPRIGDDGEVTWHRAGGPLRMHRFGMAQPGADAPTVEPSQLDAVLVPGRCFDRHGIRLGRGGGHYDRLVPRLRPGIPVIGVCADDRVVDRLPSDVHDAPMTHLATESGVHPVGRR